MRDAAGDHQPAGQRESGRVLGQRDEEVVHGVTGDFKPGRFARYALAAALLSTVKGEQAPIWLPGAAALVREFATQTVRDGFPRLFLSVCAGPLVGVMGIQL